MYDSIEAMGAFRDRGFSIRLIYSDQIFHQEVTGLTQIMNILNHLVIIGQLYGHHHLKRTL